jgi:ribosome-binding factor A
VSIKRSRRVAGLVQQVTAIILQKHIGDPRLKEIHITAVDMSPDLRTAHIFFTLYDKDKRAQVEKALNKAKGHIRHLLAENMNLRYTPQIEFIYDEALLQAERITHLLENILPKEDDGE